jgi:hypothetical protein
VDAYRKHLLQNGLSGTWRAALRRTVHKLWIYRRQLRDHLSFDPSVALDGWHEGDTKATRGENSTDRIPEQVLGPLLVWSLRYVQDFASDILRARTEVPPLDRTL